MMMWCAVFGSVGSGDNHESASRPELGGIQMRRYQRYRIPSRMGQRAVSRSWFRRVPRPVTEYSRVAKHARCVGVGWRGIT